MLSAKKKKQTRESRFIKNGCRSKSNNKSQTRHGVTVGAVVNEREINK